MSATIDRLREAVAAGQSYEALQGYRSVLNRKCNMRKDRGACVQFIVDGLQAIIAGAKEENISKAEAPLLVDIGSQLVDCASALSMVFARLWCTCIGSSP